MIPVIGKPIYGPSDERRFVTAFDDETVALVAPLSGKTETMTRAELDVWADASDRRSYIGPGGEMRTKLRTFERAVHDPATGLQRTDEAGVPIFETAVQFMHAPGSSYTVTLVEWDAWRAQAE